MFPGATLAILAGGQGLRLGGAAKGLLSVGGQTCLSRLLALGAAFEDVLLVTADGRYAGQPVRQVRDLLPFAGPVAGVHSAVAHARTPEVAVVACDMPFLTEEAMALLAKAPGAAVAFEVEGALAPLPAWLRVSASTVEGCAALGEPSLKGLLAALGGVRVPEGVLRAVDPALATVVSLNTPEDLARHGAKRR